MRFLGRVFRRPDPAAPRRLPSPDELVLLTGADNEPSAELYRGILADQGVQAMLKRTDPLTVNYGFAGLPGSCELWVLRKDLARARAALDLPAADDR